ncbi:MAG: hypothetical protein OSJ59_05780 [Lachnospiraceae bacterium]|nr:hypothetical protein [Lachnospiraceae bacterium]
MDTVLPDEMEPSDISAGFTLNELENYASLYLCTEKWHRYTWGKKTDKMLILSRKNKQLLKGSQLANYYEQLGKREKSSHERAVVENGIASIADKHG